MLFVRFAFDFLLAPELQTLADNSDREIVWALSTAQAHAHPVSQSRKLSTVRSLSDMRFMKK